MSDSRLSSSDVPHAYLPNFIIGGAPRSGTTYLAEGLSRHPQIFMATPLIPEPKVFKGDEQPASVYYDRYRRLFSSAPQGALRVEKTSTYLECSQSCTLIRRVLPDVRFIFVVREPVARAYSNYLWSTKNGLETLSFEEAVALEGQRVSPLPPEKSYARPFDYLARSDYASLARKYFEAFGKERVRFFLFEDIQLRPRQFWREVQDFLAVDAMPAAQLDAGVVNSAKEVAAPIDSRIEARLRDRLRSSVSDFQRLTKLDLSAWRYAA